MECLKSEIAPYIRLSEPKLLFSPVNEEACEIHPLRGLLQFGPYSKNLIPDPIRVATIVPSADGAFLYGFMANLREPAIRKERVDYLCDWPGFHEVFGIQVMGADKNCHIELEPELDQAILNSLDPHNVLSAHIVRAIQRLQTYRTMFEVLVIYLPERWSPGFASPPEEGFDLHDHLKAITAELGMPIQIVKEDGALAYKCQASVRWHVGLALYVKAGGVPWKLAADNPETAYVGISYAIRPNTREKNRFVTCCSQVFDCEGSGLEFVAYDAQKDEVELRRDNPFLSRTEMFRVMTRSLDLYRRRHAGKIPQRVMVHKNTEFKAGEIKGTLEAFHLCKAVDLIQVVEDVNWRGVKIDRRKYNDRKGEPTPFPVSRGTLVRLGPRDVLLWTHGDVANISQRGSYFQGAKSTPRPVRLVRHAGHGPWDETAGAVLGLTKMNWNNDALYDTLPVTLSYAKVLARVMKRIPDLQRTPYEFRFFM